jgi:hypothetical protein
MHFYSGLPTHFLSGVDIGYLSPIDCERRYQATAVDPDAHQPAAVLAAVRGRP